MDSKVCAVAADITLVACGTVVVPVAPLLLVDAMTDGRTRTPSLAIAWYMPASCSVVIDRPWPIGRLAKVLEVHCDFAGSGFHTGTTPRSSESSMPVFWPRPNFCSSE